MHHTQKLRWTDPGHSTTTSPRQQHSQATSLEMLPGNRTTQKLLTQLLSLPLVLPLLGLVSLVRLLAASGSLGPSCCSCADWLWLACCLYPVRSGRHCCCYLHTFCGDLACYADPKSLVRIQMAVTHVISEVGHAPLDTMSPGQVG